MLNVMVLGVITFCIGLIGYVSWTRGRTYPPTGYALGSIWGAKFAMGLGVVLFTSGLVGPGPDPNRCSGALSDGEGGHRDDWVRRRVGPQ
jgi:hypothetical protein